MIINASSSLIKNKMYECGSTKKRRADSKQRGLGLHWKATVRKTNSPMMKMLNHPATPLVCGSCLLKLVRMLIIAETISFSSDGQGDVTPGVDEPLENASSNSATTSGTDSYECYMAISHSINHRLSLHSLTSSLRLPVARLSYPCRRG